MYGFYKNRTYDVLLIRWSPERPDNRFYARHSRFLAGLGLPVPRLFFDFPRDHFMAIEDLGDETLSRACRDSRPAPAGGYIGRLWMSRCSCTVEDCLPHANADYH